MENKGIVTKEDRIGGGGFGIGRGTMVNGDLPYSTGNSMRYSVIAYMEMGMCMCITESLCWTAEINTTL